MSIFPLNKLTFNRTRSIFSWLTTHTLHRFLSDLEIEFLRTLTFFKEDIKVFFLLSASCVVFIFVSVFSACSKFRIHLRLYKRIHVDHTPVHQTGWGLSSCLAECLERNCTMFTYDYNKNGYDHDDICRIYTLTFNETQEVDDDMTDIYIRECTVTGTTYNVINIMFYFSI